MKTKRFRMFRVFVSAVLAISVALLGYSALRAKRVMLDKIDGLRAEVSELEQGCPL